MHTCSLPVGEHKGRTLRALGSVQPDWTVGEVATTIFSAAGEPGGMVEAWIQLRCPVCEQTWEDSPADLPAPDTTFECPSCGATRSTSLFMKDQRDLEILKQFAE